MLIYEGKLDGVRVREYQGDVTHYLQFVEQNGDGSLGFLEIKVPSDVNVTQFEKGKLVRVPVELSAMDGKIYYRVSKHSAGMSGRPEKQDA